MFTDVMFYIAWVALTLMPLMIAVLAPQTVKGKIIAYRRLWDYHSNI